MWTHKCWPNPDRPDRWVPGEDLVSVDAVFGVRPQWICLKKNPKQSVFSKTSVKRQRTQSINPVTPAEPFFGDMCSVTLCLPSWWAVVTGYTTAFSEGILCLFSECHYLQQQKWSLCERTQDFSSRLTRPHTDQITQPADVQHHTEGSEKDQNHWSRTGKWNREKRSQPPETIRRELL